MGRKISGVFAAVLCTIWAASAFAAADCGPTRLVVENMSAKQVFNVEIADDEASRALGLMNRESMPKTAGMLFVYDHPASANFWMANTLIPLDMIFAGADGTVSNVHANAVPLDRSVIAGGENVQFVLEINGGLAAKLGIEPGSKLIHPAIGNCAE